MRKECGFFVSPNLSLLFSCGSHILRVNNTLEKELKKLHPDDAPQSPDLEYACWGSRDSNPNTQDQFTPPRREPGVPALAAGGPGGGAYISPPPPPGRGGRPAKAEGA